jgi:hypothetical protein
VDIASLVYWFEHPLVPLYLNPIGPEDTVFVGYPHLLMLQNLGEVLIKRVYICFYYISFAIFFVKLILANHKFGSDGFVVVNSDHKRTTLLVDGQHLIVLTEGLAGELVKLLEIDQLDEHIANVLYLHNLVHLFNILKILVLRVSPHKNLRHLKQRFLQEN